MQQMCYHTRTGRAPRRLWINASLPVDRTLILSRMLTVVNSLEKTAVVRLLEFLSDRKPWYRCLWGIDVVLAMDELYVLRQQMQQVPRADSAAHFGIRELSVRVAADYLARWGRAVAAGKFTVERFARSVAAHLLDSGFAGQYLHDVIKARLAAPEPITLPELCDALQEEMSANPLREFDVLLAFATIPQLPNGVPSSWLQGAAVTAWLREQGFDTAGVRSPVAMVVKVQARDDIGAAQAARDEADRYAARALIATGEPLNRIPMLWVKGSAAPVFMKRDSRGVGVKELFREDRVFSADASQSVDAALELLAHLEGSSPPAAVAGGWGAIEGLLADPSDRATAADNLATLVTCSFPRAELTALSYRAQYRHPDQCAELESSQTNRERSRIVAKMIIDGRMPEMPGVSDQAAVARLKKLFANPGHELQTIREAIGESFHRLYRQRNLILHGARLDSVALTASLRTVAKLVGAGMDRITHGHYVQNLRPLELVAKANLALALVSRESPLACVDLLEVN